MAHISNISDKKNISNEISFITKSADQAKTHKNLSRAKIALNDSILAGETLAEGKQLPSKLISGDRFDISAISPPVVLSKNNIFSRPEPGTGIPGAIAPEQRRGRGANTNHSGRFEKVARIAFDDGWSLPEALSGFKTEVYRERPRTAITRNESPDVPFDRSINPYRGCEHGCIYCFARPTHAYLGLSPGLDFESKLFVKDNLPTLLQREISAEGYQPRHIAIGTNTDPYQPIEKTHRSVRGILEVLSANNHPVSIVTKSALVLRDLDILTSMAERGLVKVCLSVTTLDPKLSRLMEPRAASPEKRLETIESLAQAGIPVGVMVAPVIPAVNDAELETILTRAHARGAREAHYTLLRLPLELRDMFSDWLMEHFPGKARHVLSLMRTAREGKLYNASFNKRMAGTGPYAWMLGRRFELALEKSGYTKTKTRLRTDLFSPKPRAGQQLSLF